MPLRAGITCALGVWLAACGSGTTSASGERDAAGSSIVDASSDARPEASAADAAHAVDAALDAKTTLDAGGNEAASEQDSDTVDVCPTCLAQRCPGPAVSCSQSTTCLGVVACVNACATAVCAQGCTSDPTIESEAEAYEVCVTNNACGLACANPPPTGGSCVEFGGLCDPIVPGFETCCADAGACVYSTVHGGSCCNAAGGACDPSNLGTCCPGTQCDPASSMCQTITCTPSLSQDCAPGDDPWDHVPCCDARLSCSPIPNSQGDICCAPDGTALPTTDTDLCCSHSYSSSSGTCGSGFM